MRHFRNYVLILTATLLFPSAAAADECAWRLHQITSSRLNTGNVTMSADGQRIAFLTFLDGAATVQVFDAPSATIRTFGPGWHPVINAAGTKIAFIDNSNELAMADIDTGNITVWQVGSVRPSLSVSADGSHIAFVAYVNGNPYNAQVFALDVATTVVTQLSSLTDLPYRPEPDQVTLSGDGSRAVWVEWQGWPVLKSFDFSTGRTRDLGYGLAPAFAYDGSRVAFLDLEAGLRLLDIDSGVGRVLVTGDRGLGYPAFSSDGQRLVFTSSSDLVGGNADLDTEVFVVDVASGSVAQVTRGTGNNAAPIVGINGDGTRVAFPDYRPLTGPNPDGNFEVFVGVCGPLVAPYEFGGFEAPLLADGSASIRKGANGRTIPVAFQLRRVGEIVTTALASLTVRQVLDTASGTTDITDLTEDAAQSSWNSGWFRYDANTEYYVFNLSTKDMSAPGTYRVRVLLDDGTVHTVDFSLR